MLNNLLSIGQTEFMFQINTLEKHYIHTPFTNLMSSHRVNIVIMSTDIFLKVFDYASSTNPTEIFTWEKYNDIGCREKREN